MEQAKIFFYDLSAQQANAAKAKLDLYVRQYFGQSLQSVQALDDPQLAKETRKSILCWANHLSNDQVDSWLEKTLSQLYQAQIFCPLVVFGQADPAKIFDLAQKVKNSNQYFDLVDPDHLDSLPTRLLNLYKIYDHLDELKTFSKEVMNLRQRIHALEKKLDV